MHRQLGEEREAPLIIVCWVHLCARVHAVGLSISPYVMYFNVMYFNVRYSV